MRQRAEGAVHSTREVRRGADTKTTTGGPRAISEDVDTLNPAYVTVQGGLTKNTGNYESVKISVTVSLPCPPDQESVRATYERASDLVDEYLKEEYEAAVGEQAN